MNAVLPKQVWLYKPWIRQFSQYLSTHLTIRLIHKCQNHLSPPEFSRGTLRLLAPFSGKISCACYITLLLYETAQTSSSDPIFSDGESYRLPIYAY